MQMSCTADPGILRNDKPQKGPGSSYITNLSPLESPSISELLYEREINFCFFDLFKFLDLFITVALLIP